MSANVEGAIAQFSQSGTTANSSKSGNGSEPLSDALEFAAVEVEKGIMKRSGWWVKALVGAGHFSTDVCQSLCVALAKSKSAQEPAEELMFVKAPPRVKPSVGYQYQVLQPEEASKIPGQLGRSMDPSDSTLHSPP